MKFYKLFSEGKNRISIDTKISDLKIQDNFSDVVFSIRKSQSYLKLIKVDDIISWLDKVSLAWSERDSIVQKNFSNKGINFLIYWFRKKHLIAISDLAFRGNRGFLVNFNKVTNTKIKLKAQLKGVEIGGAHV